VGYNLKREPFNDIRVRNALTYATPKQQIIDSVLQSYGAVATGPYKPETVWFNPNVLQHEYDLKKAKTLLAEAGFTLDAKGTLTVNGKPLKIELITNQNTTRSQIAEILQNSWKKLGINVNIRIYEWGTFLEQHIKKGNFDTFILGWNIVLDPDGTSIWHSESCKPGSTLNITCYQNEEVDGLLENGVKVFDIDSRKVYYDRIQEILAVEQPYTFLYYPYELVAVSARFKGIDPAPAGITHNFIEWYVPLAEQKYNSISKSNSKQ
jgi:peptide/nickel transport system substrate-binding protein